MIFRAIASVVLLSSIAACATGGAKFSGESVASAQLRSDTMNLVQPFTAARTKCDRIDSVTTSILGIDGEIQGNAAGAMTKGITRERWVVLACGKTATFVVTFTPDGKGGTFFGVIPEI